MRPGWVKLPLDIAAPWLSLGAVPRAIGAELFRTWQEHPVVGVTMASVEDVVVRLLAPDAHERKTLRLAVRAILEAGLIVPSERGVRLLYSRQTYDHHTPMVPQWSPNGPPMVPRPYVNGPVSVTDKSAESLNTVVPIEREKEREKERTPLPPRGERAKAGPIGPRDPDPECPDDLPAMASPVVSACAGQEVREGWAEAWFAADAGVPPMLTGKVFAAAVAFAQGVASVHGKPLREAARAVAGAAIARHSDADQRGWALSRLDPFAAPARREPETSAELFARGREMRERGEAGWEQWVKRGTEAKERESAQNGARRYGSR